MKFSTNPTALCGRKPQRRDIISRGFDEKTVRWVQRRVDLNEYKREQAAPGLKVTSRAFGIGRKMPIAQKYVD
jgi:hypothetical protein